MVLRSRLFAGILALTALLAATATVALAKGGSTYRGTVDNDKSQKLSFKVSGGKVRKWKATIYATCFGGGQLTTVTIPATKLKGGKFSRKYQPVKSSETFVTVKGKVGKSKASGTVKETGSCSFAKVRWKAKKK